MRGREGEGRGRRGGERGGGEGGREGGKQAVCHRFEFRLNNFFFLQELRLPGQLP